MVTVERWTGREVRALRDALTMSVRDFATHTNLATSTITDIEAKGEHANLRRATQRILDEALATAPQPAQQRFHTTTQATSHYDRNRTGEDRAPTPREAQGLDGPVDPRQAESMRRSAFLRAAGAGLAGILVPPLVHGWPDTRRHHEVDEADLVRLQAQTEGLRWMDRREGSAHLLAHTADHARTTTTTWRSSRGDPALRSRLAGVAADACHLVAYQAFDQGQRTGALEWYRCSAELAAHAGDRDLYVFAMCGVAYMHARNGQPLPSLGVLHQLSELLHSTTARYYLAVYEAHAHAAAGDEYAALHALDNAQSLAEREGDQGTSAPWLGVPDPVFVERQRGMILADLGADSGEAVLSWLDQHTPISFQRYRVTLLTSQAQLHARRGEPEQATNLLARAVGRNAHIRSRERLARMTQIRAALAPFGDVAGLEEVDHQLRPQLWSGGAVQAFV